MDVLKEDVHERRIIVENLPQGVKGLEQKLVIHFQKSKHGGGDVESVSVLENGRAIITFEDREGKLTQRMENSFTSVSG